MIKKDINTILAERKKNILFLGILLFCAFLIRMPLNNWGEPYLLHPDEGCVVGNTIDMISRKSFETYVFDRPDHFEIKLDSIVFQAASYLRYGLDASEAAALDPFFFYFLARAVTMCFGLAIIPVSYCIGKRLGPAAGAAAALTAAFTPAFVEHSGYATPDIPLTFFSLMTLFAAIRYLEEEKMKWLVFMCLFTAAAITVKYSGAVLCFLIAAAVVQKSMEKYKISQAAKQIAVKGICSAAGVLFFIFLISPVLFTNFQAVEHAFTAQAGGVHPGLDGLDFFGKLLFYLKCMGSRLGIIYVLFSLAGIWYLFREKNRYRFLLLFGAVFWVFLSVPNLHAERWSLPMYITPIFFGAAAIARLVTVRKKAVLALSAVYLINMAANCGCIVLEKTAPDIRVYSYDWCVGNGITANQSISEGYTPFVMTGPANIYQNFSVNDGMLRVVNEELKDRAYVVLGGMNLRYYEDEERFSDILQIYRAIRTQYEPVKKFSAARKDYDMIEAGNVYKCIKFVRDVIDKGYAGYAVEIYRINNAAE